MVAGTPPPTGMVRCAGWGWGLEVQTEMDEGCVSRPRLQVIGEGWSTGPDVSSTKVTAFLLGQTRGSLFPSSWGLGGRPLLAPRLGGGGLRSQVFAGLLAPVPGRRDNRVFRVLTP